MEVRREQQTIEELDDPRACEAVRWVKKQAPLRLSRRQDPAVEQAPVLSRPFSSLENTIGPENGRVDARDATSRRPRASTPSAAGKPSRNLGLLQLSLSSP